MVNLHASLREGKNGRWRVTQIDDDGRARFQSTDIRGHETKESAQSEALSYGLVVREVKSYDAGETG